MATTKTIKINIDEVKFDPDKYPRKKANQIAIAMLQAVLETATIPPIEINQNHYLIDGFHRLQAYKLEGYTTIKAIVTNCPDGDILWLSAQRNSTHGQQLSREEKKGLAKLFFRSDKQIDDMIPILAVGKSQLYEWLGDEIKKRDEVQEAQIMDLYLRCLTEEQIASEVGLTQPAVHKSIITFSENGKSYNRPESIQDYNLWEFNVADDGSGEEGFPGRMPGQVIENLLWYFTEIFDLVVDPMSGGGTTLDVCLEMKRRCLCYDIDPIIRPHETQKHDILDGLPNIPNLRQAGKVIKPKLLLLDPPYWKQRKGDYSSDKNNLANLPLDGFHARMVQIINQAHDYIDPDGYVAFVISPTRDSGIIYDHMASIINRLDLSHWHIKERVIVSYTTQQALAYHLTQAREGKYMLRRFRDLLILQPKKDKANAKR